MKILNLYAGIGGNRKLWGDDHDITAVEYDSDIAAVYKQFFPNDNVIVGDAHEFLLKNFQSFDFIWASPPCQSHSVCNNFLKGLGVFRYPDMKLWQEIIFLNHMFKGKYCVENVKSYYEPLIKPQTIGRHYVWANFFIPEKKIDYIQIGRLNGNQRNSTIRQAQIPELTDLHGLELTGIKLKNKRQVLRNCVYPEMGKHILDAAIRQEQLFFKETT